MYLKQLSKIQSKLLLLDLVKKSRYRPQTFNFYFIEINKLLSIETEIHGQNVKLCQAGKEFGEKSTAACLFWFRSQLMLHCRLGNILLLQV